MKKILFVVPSHDGEVLTNCTPKFFINPVAKYMQLGILSIAACIKNCDINILDASSKGLTIEETIDQIECYKPDILAITSVTYRAWALGEILDKTSCPTKVVGGPHATFNAQIILNQGATAVFIGDSEITFPKWIEDGCPEGIFTGDSLDLDTLPLPARHLVDLEDYKTKPDSSLLLNVGNLRLSMFSSKGCPFKCIYCDVQEKTFIFKSAEKILQEFQALLNLGATSIHILDDCFNIKKDRVLKLCELLIKENVKADWSVRGKVETREEVIKALAEAGCKRFHVGIEHLDDVVLKYFRKNHRFKDVQTFCNLCKKYGIIVLGYFIIGAPNETERYREIFPDLIKGLKIPLPYFNVLTPLYKTEYYDQLLTDGILEKDYWKEFIENPVRDFVFPSGRTKEEDEKLYDDVARYMDIFYKDKMK